MATVRCVLSPDHGLLPSYCPPVRATRRKSLCRGSTRFYPDAVGRRKVRLPQKRWSDGLVPGLPRLLLLPHGVYERCRFQVCIYEGYRCACCADRLSSIPKLFCPSTRKMSPTDVVLFHAVSTKRALTKLSRFCTDQGCNRRGLGAPGGLGQRARLPYSRWRWGSRCEPPVPDPRERPVGNCNFLSRRTNCRCEGGWRSSTN